MKKNFAPAGDRTWDLSLLRSLLYQCSTGSCFVNEDFNIVFTNTIFDDPALIPQGPPTKDYSLPRPYRDTKLTPQVHRFIPWCWFRTSHVVSQCPIFWEELKAQDRADLLKELGRCFTFWKPVYNPSSKSSHNSVNCSHPRGCSYCGRDNHHTFLHGAKFSTMKKSGH